MTQVRFSATVEIDGEDIEVDVRALVSRPVPGRLYGACEDCYPEEGPQCERMRVFDAQSGAEVVPPADVLRDLEGMAIDGEADAYECARSVNDDMREDAARDARRERETAR